MKINEKKRLKNIRRRIFYRLQTSADTKKHQKVTLSDKLIARPVVEDFYSKILTIYKLLFYRYFINLSQKYINILISNLSDFV